MKIKLSDHFGYGRLLRFTVPSMVMLLFVSVYSVVDGLFISNFVGITPFAAINLIFPFTMILAAFGFMFGTGGTALVSAKLGERKPEEANRIFSMLTWLGFGLGVALAVLGIAFLRPISLWLGADEAMLPYCIQYGQILLLALPGFMLQNMFQSFLITAEKPTLGLIVTIAAGLTNIVLDALFVAVFRWGLVGAAFATFTAQWVGGLIPLVYFLRKNSSLLRLGKFTLSLRPLCTACTNGLSELVTNISMSVVSILYNFQLMRLAGENGVAAYGAVMYISFAFVSLFIGYSIGVAPVVGFHYGAQNHGELRGLLRKSNTLICLGSLLLAAAAFLLATPLARLFVGDTPELLEMTETAFRYYAVSVLFSGFSIFGSSFFTALNNGIVSATISFLRTLVFQIAAVLLLPHFFGLDGIWYSLFVAEILSLLVTIIFYKSKQTTYHY
jgi:putative MATE family efflux protein